MPQCSCSVIQPTVNWTKSLEHLTHVLSSWMQNVWLHTMCSVLGQAPFFGSASNSSIKHLTCFFFFFAFSRKHMILQNTSEGSFSLPPLLCFCSRNKQRTKKLGEGFHLKQVVNIIAFRMAFRDSQICIETGLLVFFFLSPSLCENNWASQPYGS